VTETRCGTCTRMFSSAKNANQILESCIGRTPKAYRFVSLEKNYSTTLVSSCKIVSSLIKLDGRDDIGCGMISQERGSLMIQRGQRVARPRWKTTNLLLCPRHLPCRRSTWSFDCQQVLTEKTRQAHIPIWPTQCQSRCVATKGGKPGKAESMAQVLTG
jgi:hypothetical protein